MTIQDLSCWGFQIFFLAPCLGLTNWVLVWHSISGPPLASSSCSGFAQDMYLDTGVVFFWVFCTLHHPVALVLLGTFIWTQGLFFSGFLHTASSTCSSFAWDIYLDTGVGFFGFFRTLCHPDAPAFLGTFTQTWGLFFSGFPHTTSSSCSGFAQHIYPDTGVGFFGFSAHYIMQMLQPFLGHLPGDGGCFFGVSTHYIMQMLWLCSGHLPRHRGHFFRVFHTLHHPDALAFLGTFTWTWGLFFLGFPHTPSSSHSSFAWDIYPDIGVGFSGFLHTTWWQCSSIFWDIYLDMGVVFFGVSAHYIIQSLWFFSFFLVFLPNLKSDALENSAFSLAIYLHSRVTSLDLGIGPNYYP